MPFLTLALTILAIGLAPTPWGALSIPLGAAALTLISTRRRGADGIGSFYAILLGAIIVCLLLTGLILVGKRLIGAF